MYVYRRFITMAKRRVSKAEPNLDTKPSGGLSFSPSDKTKSIMTEISDQMADPDIQGGIGEESPDDSGVLDSVFGGMLSPPPLAIANVATRKKLEESLPPIDIDSLFLRGEIRQRVPVLKKLSITFRTLSGKEDLYIKRKLSDVRSEVARYIEDRYMMMQLAAHIVAINDELLPEMLDGAEVSDEKFNKRFDRVCAFPVFIIERVWVHWVWFQDRVTKEINDDFLSGG
jgi:hypothetical protein